MKIKIEAKRISKDVLASAAKLGVRPCVIYDAVGSELNKFCSSEEVGRLNVEADSIGTREQAAEWAAKEWLAADLRAEDDCFGEGFGWKKAFSPTAKDFLDRPELFENFVKPMLDFDYDSPEEKAYYRLVVKVLDMGLGRKGK